MVTRTILLLVLGVAACGGPTKPAVPVTPPSQPITRIDQLDGTWHSTDVDGWDYKLTIGAGRFEQLVVKTDGGQCSQKGAIQEYEKAYGAPYDPAQFGGNHYGGGEKPYALVMTLEENKCNPDYTGAQLITLATEFTGDGVMIRTGQGYGGAQESHHYTRVIAPPESGGSAKP